MWYVVYMMWGVFVCIYVWGCTCVWCHTVCVHDVWNVWGMCVYMQGVCMWQVVSVWDVGWV